MDSVMSDLEAAFGGAVMPTTEAELAPPSIDAGYVYEHFLGKDRSEAAAGFLPALHMEDFTYMTDQAVAYYLPVALERMLADPYDFELWTHLYSFLRGHRRSVIPIPALSAAQRRAIVRWAEHLRELWTVSGCLYPDEADVLIGAYGTA